MYQCITKYCFFNDTATTEIYTYCHTLSLHDALPISHKGKKQPRIVARLHDLRVTPRRASRRPRPVQLRWPPAWLRWPRAWLRLRLRLRLLPAWLRSRPAFLPRRRPWRSDERRVGEEWGGTV